jgi:hypothetical protein
MKVAAASRISREFGVRQARRLHPETTSVGVDPGESLRRETFMADQEWGLCKDCKWWQIEPEASVENLTLGLCIEEKLQPFRLRVSGVSGCNRYRPGEPARAKGSGEAPPLARPTR